MRRADDTSDDWHLAELTDTRDLADINGFASSPPLGDAGEPDYDPDYDPADDSDADCHCGPAVPLAILTSMLIVGVGVALLIMWLVVKIIG
jgi:hypothetical protein